MKLLAVAVAAAMLVGCASTGRGYGAAYSPIVDRPGANYAQDLSECQQYAAQLPSAGDGAAAGALGGAIFGVLLGAAFHVGSRDTAWAGALGGATGGAARSENDQRSVISNCLRSRGYAVLQ